MWDGIKSIEFSKNFNFTPWNNVISNNPSAYLGISFFLFFFLLLLEEGPCNIVRWRIFGARRRAKTSSLWKKYRPACCRSDNDMDWTAERHKHRWRWQKSLPCSRVIIRTFRFLINSFIIYHKHRHCLRYTFVRYNKLRADFSKIFRFVYLISYFCFVSCKIIQFCFSSSMVIS